MGIGSRSAKLYVEEGKGGEGSRLMVWKCLSFQIFLKVNNIFNDKHIYSRSEKKLPIIQMGSLLITYLVIHPFISMNFVTWLKRALFSEKKRLVQIG